MRTFLQSGNVLFEDDGDQAAAERLEALIEATFGIRAPVVLRRRDELGEVLERDPLGEVATDPSRHLVAFLSAVPDPLRVDAIDAQAFLPDRFAADGRHIHLWYPNGVHVSRLTNSLLERRLGVVATSRNWNTISRLFAMLGEDAPASQ